jgi:hypothetical protein
MADKIVSTLNASVITNVVTALAESITTAKNSASALVSFAQAAAKAKFPRTPNEADVVAVVDALSAKLGWNGTPREKVSKSEARNIVRQHAYLNELQTALRASPHGACSYHDAVKLCRLMKSEGSVGAAVLAFNTKAEAKPVDADKKFKTALQSFYQVVSEEKGSKAKTAKLAALRACAEALGFDAVAGAEASH